MQGVLLSKVDYISLQCAHRQPLFQLYQGRMQCYSSHKQDAHPSSGHYLKCFILLRTTAAESLASTESYH